MTSFARLVRRFGHDERGAFAVIFGILAVVLVATSGAVVDFVSVEQARTKAQVALDAAALALNPDIYTKNDTQLLNAAEDLITERLADSTINVSMQQVETNTNDGTLYLRAKLQVPLYFVALIGFQNMDVQIASETTRKKLDVEVVMVLDNSGSMSNYSRMTNLKTAATNATNILFEGNEVSPNVKIGIVPFTSFVNVGSAYADATWIDQDGLSSISNDNFDDDNNDTTPFTGAVDRLALYDGLSNESWRGCVEARPHTSTGGATEFLDTDDTTPDSGTPDTLFVPQFAPDEPYGWNNSFSSDSPASCPAEATWVWTQVMRQCDRRGNNESNYDRANCYGSTTNTYVLTDQYGAVTNPTTPPATIDNNTPSIDVDYSSSGSGSNRTNTRVTTYTYKYSDRELQERLCKYTGASVSYSGQYGPNTDCPETPVLPLSNTKQNVLDTISSMNAGGNTNIHMGTVWGWRVLSPTEPFTEGEEYDEAVSKVMIIMTDGENTLSSSSNMNGGSYYSAYGFPWNGRIASPYTTNMNSRMADTCTNAKAMDIEIYTIGLNSPNSTTTNLLTNCATDASHAYFPTAANELDDIFEDIANRLSDLRLAK